MIVKRNYFLFICSLLTLLLVESFSKYLNFSGKEKKTKETIEKYFPHENNLLVVLAESSNEVFLPTFLVPVVVLTQDQVLKDCKSKMMDQDGYVLRTSDAKHLEDHVVPLLKCLNQTTLQLKTKYILVLDLSKDIDINSFEAYSNFFHKLWTVFGIINIAILPVLNHSTSNNPNILLSYNPFLARHQPSALIKNNLTKDIRAVMIGRFRNMYGYRIKAVFYTFLKFITFSLKDLQEQQPLGANMEVLFKQTLEEKLNISFDIYESSFEKTFGLGQSSGSDGGELRSGRAEYCINYSLSPPLDVLLLSKIQAFRMGFFNEVIIIVPKPRQIESWRYFQYIFQWPVSVGLGIVLCLLSCAAILFQNVFFKFNASSHRANGIPEIVSVWLAVLSASINNLPSEHSQRSLIALSLLLGLIFVPIFCAQLFNLIKTKPSLAPIRTLQDLCDSNLPVYAIDEHFKAYLDMFENTTLQRIKDNFKTDKLYKNANFLDPKYLNITDRAVIYVGDMIYTATKLPQNKHVKQCFDIIKEPLARIFLTLKIPVGSVYYDHFYDMSLRLMSSGIYDKWKDASTQQTLKKLAAFPKPQVKQGHQQPDEYNAPLTYEDLKMAFYILYTGLTVSTLCFLVELFKS